MSERDELAAVIVTAYGEDAEVECPCEQDLEVADAILAAGYRKPRTITTAEELDALPDDAVVLDDMDGPLTKMGDWWHSPADEMRSAQVILPTTVLWEPQP